MNNRELNSQHKEYLSEFKLLCETMKQLDLVAFIWNAQGNFNAIYPLPQWFKELYLSKSGAQIIENNEFFLGTHFPFIENFLYDAEQVWSGELTDNDTPQTSRPLRSGIWTENQTNGNELYIEAIAMHVNNKALLVLSNETTNFDVRHKVFQNARNLALKNEKLESSVQQHQRQLQKQLESLIKSPSELSSLPESLDQESSAVLICKDDGNVEVYNKALVDIYSLNDAPALQRESLLEKWTQEAERLYPEIHRVIKSGHHWEGEFESTDYQNKKKWVRLIIAPIKDEDSLVNRYICIANDISNIRLNINEIERLTQIDATTQLPNRRHFWQYLTREVEQQNQPGNSLALLYVDLDHFRQVNEDLGPRQADFLLNAVATRIKRCLKKHDYVAHLGGDEFAVVVTGFNDQHALANIAQRVIDNIQRDVSFNELTINIGASIGIAVYPQHGLKARQLVKSADYAMYHAKELGRNQFKFSSPYSQRKIKQRLYIEQGLKQAITNKEFELLFQPQIAIGEKTEHRLEALIRWQHPQKGRVTPEDFISIAEESGLIIEIGNWVIERACEQVATLNSIGVSAVISINVSPKQFKYSDLSQAIISAIKKFQISPSQLELELTESIFVEEVEEVVKQLNDIRAFGVTISLDDFGTGYSSLSYLKKLPIDILKIDRSFIQELPENSQSATIVDTIIAMAHELQIRVVAEGVESQAQYEYLKSKNCDYVQGYLFYAPLEGQQILELYTSFKK